MSTGATTIKSSALVALGLVVTGCGGPLIVSAAQSRGEEVKFAYTQAGTGDQGLIECKVPASGDLQECRHMKITWKE